MRKNNMVVNYCVDENRFGIVRVDVIRYLFDKELLDGMLGNKVCELNVDDNNWIEILNNRFNDYIENEGDVNYLKLLRKNWLLFIGRLKKVINEKKRVVYYMGSEKSDWNVGVMIVE